MDAKQAATLKLSAEIEGKAAALCDFYKVTNPLQIQAVIDAVFEGYEMCQREMERKLREGCGS